ncbi:acyltransferase [Terrarubrum flagellatum]|uniref:acyltransferase family protein n=1 Tax=Terrirubrum flagellatum TaxID=2895980 RepID=UPI0031454E46
MSLQRSQPLLTLEAGRFFAATAVVLFHYTGVVHDFRGVNVFGDLFRPGHVGVPYFFVLSGFIIYHVHRDDIGRPGTIARFAAKRAIRLMPMFWMISLVMLAGFLLSPGLLGKRELTFPGVIADLLLLPHANAILSISWTLRHEMVFYALFALALWLGRPAFGLIAIWIALSLVGSAFSLDVDSLGLLSLVGSGLNLGFGLGILVAIAVLRRSVAPAGLWIVAGGGGLLALCAAEWLIGRGTSHDIAILGAWGGVAYLIAAAVLIYGLVRFEAGRTLPAAGLWKMLGGASYLLYLVHQPLASAAFRVVPPLKTMAPELAFILLTAAAIVVALLGHLLVEKPILAFLSGQFTQRSGATRQVPGDGSGGVGYASSPQHPPKLADR